MVKESYHYRWHLAVPLLSLGHFPPQEYSFGSYETQKTVVLVNQHTMPHSFIGRGQNVSCTLHIFTLVFSLLVRVHSSLWQRVRVERERSDCVVQGLSPDLPGRRPLFPQSQSPVVELQQSAQSSDTLTGESWHRPLWDTIYSG